MAGQPSEVATVAIQPSAHFFENPCHYSANPDNQALTKHGSRKSIKPLLHSSLLLFSLASDTCAVGLRHQLYCTLSTASPFPPGNGTAQLHGERQDAVPGSQLILLLLTKHREFVACVQPGYLGALPSAGRSDYRSTQRRAAPYRKLYCGTKDAALSQSPCPQPSTAVCWVTASFTSLHLKL